MCKFVNALYVYICVIDMCFIFIFKNINRRNGQKMPKKSKKNNPIARDF